MWISPEKKILVKHISQQHFHSHSKTFTIVYLHHAFFSLGWLLKCKGNLQKKQKYLSYKSFFNPNNNNDIDPQLVFPKKNILKMASVLKKGFLKDVYLEHVFCVLKLWLNDFRNGGFFKNKFISFPICFRQINGSHLHRASLTWIQVSNSRLTQNINQAFNNSNFHFLI